MATNYTEYSKWKAVTLPTGGIVYKVPDQPGWVYDPVLSAAKGRPVMFIDPSARLDEQNKAKEAADKAQRQQEQANSVWGQVAPTLGTIGGIAGGTALANWLSPSAAAPVAAPGPGSVITGGGGGTAFGGVTDLGAIGPGSTGAPVELAAPTGLSATPVGATPVGATPFSLSGVAANAGSMGFLPLAGIAAGTYLGGKAAYDMLKGKDDKSIPGYIGRGTLAVATGGLSELAKASGLFGHKSTRQSAADKTNYLMGEAEGDPNAQAYVQGMREQFNTAPVGNAYAGGNYATFDEYKKAGLDPKDLSGVYGNMETFGPTQWANLTQDQREAVTKGLIDADLYKSKKGDIEITDKNKAKEIYANILGPQQQVELNPTTPPPQPAVSAQNLKPPTKTEAQDIKLGTQLAEKFNNRIKKR